MKRSGRPSNSKKFHEYKHLVRRVTDRAYERYLGDILGLNATDSPEENLPGPPPPPLKKVNTKKLY